MKLPEYTTNLPHLYICWLHAQCRFPTMLLEAQVSPLPSAIMNLIDKTLGGGVLVMSTPGWINRSHFFITTWGGVLVVDHFSGGKRPDIGIAFPGDWSQEISIAVKYLAERTGLHGEVWSVRAWKGPQHARNHMRIQTQSETTCWGCVFFLGGGSLPQVVITGWMVGEMCHQGSCRSTSSWSYRNYHHVIKYQISRTNLRPRWDFSQSSDT